MPNKDLFKPGKAEKAPENEDKFVSWMVLFSKLTKPSQICTVLQLRSLLFARRRASRGLTQRAEATPGCSIGSTEQTDGADLGVKLDWSEDGTYIRML